MLRIETVGLNEAIIRIEAFSETMRLPIARTMREWAELVMAESKQIVPVDSGALMNSGHVQGPDLKSGAIEVLLGYGGVAVDYALKVHENMNPNIHWQRPGSGPKYLEKPFMAKLGELEASLQAALSAAARSI